jgi:large subunit ribosomal protein L2
MLTKYKQKLKYLLTRKKKNAGRNNTGRITVAHQGGGQKQKYRQIKFDGNISEGFVSNFEYDPNRSAFLAKICCLKNNKKVFYYILAPQNLKILDPIEDFQNNFIIKSKDDITSTKLTGNCYFLKDLAVGDFVYNIEIYPNTNAKMIRAAGTFGTILKKDDLFVTIKLPSNEIRLFSKDCKAFLGCLTNDSHTKNI